MNTATQFLASDADNDTPMPPPWQGDIDARDENFFALVGSLRQKQPELALAVCRKAFVQAEMRGDRDAAVAALLRLYGVVYGTLEAPLLLRDLWALILERAEAVVDPVVAIRLTTIDMVRLLDDGEDAQVLTKGHSVLAQAMAIGNEHLLMLVLSPIEMALRHLGELDLALDVHKQMAPLLRGGEPFAISFHATRSNNEAMLWLEFARTKNALGDAAAVQVALENAREQAQLSCALAFVKHRLNVANVDTLIQVLLKLDDPVAARTRLEQFESTLAAPPNPGTETWGLLQLAKTHIDMHEERDPQGILHALQAVERVQGNDFQIGGTHRVIQTALAQVHERLGQYEQALACHKRLADWQSQAHTAVTRERVKMMRHAVLAMRTEAVEFITHDLRTPLTAARTWLHTVVDEQLPASSQTALREAELRLRDAFDLSDLYLSVLRAEFLPPSALQRLDLGALTDDLCESLSPPIASLITLTRDTEIGVEVIGHARLLTRALAALLNHAFKRAPADTAVHVRLARAQAGSVGEVQVSVAVGVGSLPLQTRLRLYQCHAPGTAEGVSPLGLVARVARLHQARIRIDSPPAGGSTVTLRFKLADDFSVSPRTHP